MLLYTIIYIIQSVTDYGINYHYFLFLIIYIIYDYNHYQQKKSQILGKNSCKSKQNNTTKN